MFDRYRAIKEIPWGFVSGLPKFELIQTGEECSYFAHNNCYLFEARKGTVPWISRDLVERWVGNLFEPVKES